MTSNIDNFVRGEEAIEQLRLEGYKDIELIVIDVSREESVQAAYDELSRRVSRLDVLVNNAGIPGKLPQQADGPTGKFVSDYGETPW